MREPSSTAIVKKRGFAAALLGALLWGVLTRTALDARNYADAEDALRYVRAIEMRDFARFDAASSGWQFACTAVDALMPQHAGDAVESAKLVAEVSGTLLLPLLLTTLVVMTRRVALSLALTLLFSVAFGPWWYSLMPDKYVPQLLLLGVVLYVAIARDRPLSSRFLIGFGLVSAAAVLVHTLSGLVGLALVPLLLRSARTQGASRALRQGALSLGAMLAALTVYFTLLLGLAVKPASAGDGMRWTLSYVGKPAEHRPWGHLRAASPLLSFIGAGRSVVAIDAALGQPEVARVAAQKFPNKILVEEQYLVQRMPPWLATAAPLLIACAALALCAVIIAGARGARRLGGPERERQRGGLFIVLCWLGPTAAFIVWWEPTNNEFWIAPFYGLVLLLGPALAALDPRRGVELLVAGCAVLLGLVNFALGVGPRLDGRSDYWEARQQPLADLARDDDMVLEYGDLAADYLRRLSDAAVFPVHERGHTEPELRDALRQELDRAPHARSVFVTEMVMHATQSPAGYPQHRRRVVERFFRSLPEPEQWLRVAGHRIARYEASSLRLALTAEGAEAPGDGAEGRR